MVVSPPAPDAPIIGRRRELALLRDSLRVTLGGRLAVAFLTGDPGIGKTRLLDEIGRQALETGAQVLRGGAFDADGMPPYLPFLEALGQHVHSCEADTLRAQAGPLVSVLATILPELPARLGTPAPPYALPPEQARLRLYEAVATMLAAIAGDQPLVLILDDLQWTDPASLDLLRYVARHTLGTRLLILGAYRAGEIAHRDELERTLAELEHLRVLTTVAVSPLTPDAVAAMASLALGAPVDAALSETLHAQSEGNPVFAEELLREWRATGQVARHDRHWVLRSGLEHVGTSPPSIARIIRQRLARVPPEVEALLHTAAMLGRQFEAPLLAEVAGKQTDAVEALLLAAVEAQLLRAAGGDGYVFSHDRIREVLAEEIPPTQRRRLHGFIGRALEREPTPVDAQRLADLAFHFTRSGDRDRAVDYARRAAAHALRASAPHEAMAHFRAALRLADPLAPMHGDLLLGLGEAAVLAGAEPAAGVAFADAQRWFADQGDPVRAAGAAHLLGRARWRQEDIAQARAAFETALALVGSLPGPARVEILVDLGTLLTVSTHEPAVGIAHVRDAARLAEELGDQRLCAIASRAWGNALVRTNDLAAGIPLLEHALALASALHDTAEAAECCACLAPAYYWRGAIERSAAVSRQRLAFAVASHDRYQLRHVYTWLAVCSALRGRIVEAEHYLARAQAVVDDLESPEPRAYLAFTRGAVALMLGDDTTAETQLGDAIATLRTIGPHALVWYLGFFGLLQLALGKTDAARQCVVELATLVAGLPEASIAAGEAVACAMQIALSLDDRSHVARLAPALVAYRGQFHDLLIDRLLGELETRQGNFAAAAEHLRSAEALARQEHLVWELARTLEARAALARAAGGDAGRDERALLEEALTVAGRLGNQREMRRLHVRLGRQAALAYPTRLPRGLSAREVDVLRLAASGRSNRAIADVLSLSVKTIENHLTSVYAKLGVDNRAAAVAFAVRHDLTD